jgi:AcrR family transcriptional regulator
VTDPAGPTPAPSPTRARRERERVESRRTILAAAHDLARAEGWDAVTMRRLAERIEYSANFAYRYFSGRDDILLALVQDGFARLRTAMAEAAGPPGNETAAAIHRAAHAYLEFALDQPEIYQLMYGLGGVRVAAADAWVEGQAVGDILADHLTAAGATDPDGAVLQLWAVAHGLVALHSVGRTVLSTDAITSVLDTAVDDILTRVLAPEPRRPTRR